MFIIVINIRLAFKLKTWKKYRKFRGCLFAQSQRRQWIGWAQNYTCTTAVLLFIPVLAAAGSMASFADASVQSTRRHITISHFNAAFNLLFYFRWTVMEEILPLVQGPFYQTIIAIIEVVTNSTHTFKARKEILSRIAISDKFLIQTPFPWQNMWDHSGTFFSKFVSIVINNAKLNISLSESLFE